MSRRTCSSVSPPQSPRLLILLSIFLEAAYSAFANALFFGAAFLADVAAFLLMLAPLSRSAGCHSTSFQVSSFSTSVTSPCQDHFGMCKPSGTSSAEWKYRAIVVVVAHVK